MRFARTLLVLALLFGGLAEAASAEQQYIITTIAGTGESGFSGDEGPASQAQLNMPSDVAVDGDGNLYVADRGNHRIRRVDLSGTITTFAGTGEPGGHVSGRPASQSPLHSPSGVAVDGAGNLYIAESGATYNEISKVDSAGTITTFALGEGAPPLLALDCCGPLYHPRGLLHPEDVAVDGDGNVYVADFGNDRIRKVDPSGTMTTFAGGRECCTGSIGDGGPASQAQLHRPRGVAVDGAGNVYIADGDNSRIRRVDPSGTITTFAGTGSCPARQCTGFSGDGGPATEALLAVPLGVAVDGDGNVYIGDWGHRIRKVDATTGTITTIAGTGEYAFGGDGGPAVQARLAHPRGVAVDGAGNVYIADTSNNRIRKLTPVAIQYYFPHLAVGAGWQTTITYINYSPEEVTCQTEFLSDDGSPLMVSFAGLGTVDSRTDVLPPGGSVHQETDVDLSAPLAPGWARATCSGSVKASLLFRQRNSEGVPTAEAGVNAAAVPATRFVTFAEQGEGQFGTGVAYANPSSTVAHVTFAARDAAGQMLASADRTLLPGGHDAQGMAELFGLTSFTGSIEVTSTEPIVSLSLNFEAAPVFSSLPPGELDPSAWGWTTYYFPHLAVGASWQTTITYINYSPQEVTCQTEFFSDDGSPLMVSFADLGMVARRTDVLPSGGSVHQETNVDLNASLAPGWARANCSRPVKASLLFRQHDSEGAPTAEAGVTAAAVPATRFVTFAEQGEDQFGTGVAYVNPFATLAHVTFTVRDTAGEVLASADRILCCGGHDAQGMAELFGLTSFTGSIEVTSTEPIVSLSLNFEAAPVFSSLPPGELDAAAQ